MTYLHITEIIRAHGLAFIVAMGVAVTAVKAIGAWLTYLENNS